MRDGRDCTNRQDLDGIVLREWQYTEIHKTQTFTELEIEKIGDSFCLSIIHERLPQQTQTKTINTPR